MKLWNLNTGDECNTFTKEQIADWIVRNKAECLARHGDGTWKECISYWRTWINPFESEIWRIEP